VQTARRLREKGAEMETRRLGRTGHESTVVIFGAAAIGKTSQEVADTAIQAALDSGVNHIDVAPSYGQAEARLRPWIPKIRDQVFLGCKTTKRKKGEAAEELKRSLERLKAGRFDLYQLHSVGDLEQLDLAMGPGGALEALVEARDKGLTSYLGITGHGMMAPATHAEALRRFDFDTVMFPLNANLLSDPGYRSDYGSLCELAREKDVGLMVIKAVAKEPWGDRERTATTWYKPYDAQGDVDRCVRFALSQEITALSSAGDVDVLPLILDAASRFEPMSSEEIEETVGVHGKLRSIFVA